MKQLAVFFQQDREAGIGVVEVVGEGLDAAFGIMPGQGGDDGPVLRQDARALTRQRRAQVADAVELGLGAADDAPEPRQAAQLVDRAMELVVIGDELFVVDCASPPDPAGRAGR